MKDVIIETHFHHMLGNPILLQVKFLHFGKRKLDKGVLYDCIRAYNNVTIASFGRLLRVMERMNGRIARDKAREESIKIEAHKILEMITTSHLYGDKTDISNPDHVIVAAYYAGWMKRFDEMSR